MIRVTKNGSVKLATRDARFGAMAIDLSLPRLAMPFKPSDAYTIAMCRDDVDDLIGMLQCMREAMTE